MAVYLSNVRLALANLLGEDSIASPWPTVRDNAIQWSLERIARMYDFDFGMVALNKTTDSTGKYAFLTADGVRVDPKLDVRYVVTGANNDYIFNAVNRSDFDNYGLGDYVYYIDTDAAGAQTLVTTETSKAIQITASRVAPTLSESVATTFPSALAIAKGALIYIREYEDKDSDTSVEDAKFRQMIQEIAGAEQRSRASNRAKTRQELKGSYTGKVRGDNYWYY
jgi:hypothetical protein